MPTNNQWIWIGDAVVQTGASYHQLYKASVVRKIIEYRMRPKPLKRGGRASKVELVELRVKSLNAWVAELNAPKRVVRGV